MSWQPSATLASLRDRAKLLSQVREFFAARGVLEVETPLLGSRGVTDPNLEAFTVATGVSLSAPRFLQTSPEYAMKRLLAAHGAAIFQVCRAFRDGEAGPRHNPEFTMLEWYRPGFDLRALMDEVADLVSLCLGERPVVRYAYRELFRQHLDLDPVAAAPAAIESLARELLDVGDMRGDSDLWLDLLMSHVIEPRIAGEGMCFVYDYPASQASLARIDERDGVRVAQRFELYVDGVELANGYLELTDPAEQRRRFDADNAVRRQRGLPRKAVDERLIAALQHGLPDCSGVALGLDRLLMLRAGAAQLGEVLAFVWERA